MKVGTYLRSRVDIHFGIKIEKLSIVAVHKYVC